MSSILGGPRLPVEILKDVLDVLGQDFDRLENTPPNIKTTKKEAEQWLDDRKQCLQTMLNLSAVNKQMRRSFEATILRKHLVDDGVLRVSIHDRGQDKKVEVPKEIMERFKHLMLVVEDIIVRPGEDNSNWDAQEGLGEAATAALAKTHFKILSLRFSTLDDIASEHEEGLDKLEEAAAHIRHLHLHHNSDMTDAPNESFSWLGAFKAVTLTSVWDAAGLLRKDCHIFEHFVRRILPATLPFTKKVTRKMRVLHAMPTFVLLHSENEDELRREGPSAKPSAVFKTLDTVMRRTRIKTCLFTFNVRDCKLSDDFVWRGSCLFERGDKGHYEMTHEDDWQDPAALLGDAVWKQSQAFEAVAAERPYFDDHGASDAAFWDALVHQMLLHGAPGW